MKTLSRRQFLKMTAGTGLSIAVAASPVGYRLLSATELEKEGAVVQLSAWLRIAPDNAVTIIVNKSEMGQGVYTSLPMIVADELDADWKNVRMEAAPAADVYKDPAWGTQATGGSTTIRHMSEPLRKAGAAAREMLMTAASQEWGVPVTECAVSQGKVRHAKSARSLTYGHLAGKASHLPFLRIPCSRKKESSAISARKFRGSIYMIK